MLEVAKLTGLEEKYPHQLSGGQQQRVAIIRSLINKPRVLLMDEPFGALDIQNRWELQEFLLKTKQLTGTTIIFVTHDIDEAVFLADRIYVASPRPLRLVSQFEIPYSTSARNNQIRTREIFANLVNEVRHTLLHTHQSNLQSDVV